MIEEKIEEEKKRKKEKKGKKDWGGKKENDYEKWKWDIKDVTCNGSAMNFYNPTEYQEK